MQEARTILKERIDILINGNVITQKVGDGVNEVIDLLYDEHPETDVEVAKMFITHLAMATHRVVNNEPVEELESSIWEEVLETEHFGKALCMFKKVKGMTNVEYPESERRFLIMHICNVLQ